SEKIGDSYMVLQGNNDSTDVNNDSKVDELNAAMMESFYIIPKEQRLTGASGAYSHPSSTLSPGTHFSSG
ncbi:378_t:CDS:2, partial [Dentiscutata erythropus]